MTSITSFKELNLIAPLQRALNELSYKTPTEIQARAIPPGLQGRDILGCAQTGTGKTAAFVLPILDYLGSETGAASPGKPYVLMLAPTRELAIQIGESIEQYGRHLNLRTTTIFGGVSQTSQVRSLKQGTDILVATPGRLLDLMSQSHVNLDQLEVFVLDEADQMLDMGFLPDLKRIIRRLPEERQSLFFSATMSREIKDLARKLLFEPVFIDVAPKCRSVDKITQQSLLLHASEKVERLEAVLTEASVQRAIVFTRTKRGADKVQRKLQRLGIDAAAIHGNKSQGNRERTLSGFRHGQIQVLVATDVAARGLDVDGVSHVINYDLPGDPESYVHRIGRTGRAGAEGTAITFYTADQKKEMREIERFAGVRIEHIRLDKSDTQNQPARRDRGQRNLLSSRRSTKSNSSGGKRRKPGGTKSRNLSRC